MKRWLKHLQPIAVGLAAVLIVPSGLLAAQIGVGRDGYSQSAASDHVPAELLRVHCCHSHPYPPYDRYCCHGGGNVRPGRTVVGAAVGAAAAYGAYRGVRSATKSAYKRGYNKAKKNIKRR